mmetsp:Transcript_17137/g.25365  ORF Transcript_17137/g.25365 Transcript_17137/m.25365 type:complete len:202 (-) Transcript_17137:41-646(-)
MQSLDIENGSVMMTIFSSYEEDYLRCAREINSHINSMQKNGQSNDAMLIFKAASMTFKRAEGSIRGMEIEVRSMRGGPDKKSCFNKSQQYKNDLTALRKTFNQIFRKVSKSESGLSLIEDTREVLSSTEEISRDVLNDLLYQRQSLLRANENVNDIRDDTEEARGIMKEIALRGARHRFFLYLIIIILLVAIGVVLYYRLK